MEIKENEFHLILESDDLNGLYLIPVWKSSEETPRLLWMGYEKDEDNKGYLIEQIQS